jgi:hypothetical protein
MAANTTPIFIKQGNFTPARITAANVANDGSGTLGTNLFALVTANIAGDGVRVDGVRFTNAQATAAASSNNYAKMFLSDTSGLNFRIIGQVSISTATRTGAIAGTTIGATAIYTFDQPVIMQPGQIMAVALNFYAGVQDQTDAIAFAGNY